MIASWQESYDKPRQCVKKQRHHFANKVPYCQGYGLSSSHVQMWELDHKEGRVPKNWCLQTVVLEKTLEIPLDRKEIKPDTLKGNQPWIFIGSTDVKAETPIIWLPDGNTQLIAKDLYAGKDWRQKEKRAKEDAMIGWYHWLNGHEFEWLWEMVWDREAWHAEVQGSQRVKHNLVTEQQQIFSMKHI